MTEKLSLSTFDRLINIHQSVKLEQVVELNKELLSAQLRTNQKLNALNNQLAEANNLTKQILANQISELKREEEQRFYKSLSYYSVELIDKIENIEPIQLKAYFAKRFYAKLKGNLENAKENLEEIANKTFASNSINRLSLFSNYITSPEFANSILYNLEYLIDDYQLKENSYNKELTALKNQVNSINVPKVGLFGFNKKAMNESLNRKHELEELHSKKSSDKKEELDNHLIIQIFDTVAKDYQKFEEITNDIELADINFNKRFKPTSTKKFYDPSLVEAMKIILLHRQISSALIQRKLKFGYNRSKKIIEQLTEIGAINESKISINNIDEFDELLKKNYA